MYFSWYQIQPRKKTQVAVKKWAFFTLFYILILEKAMATHSSTLAWKNPMDGGVW